MRRILLVSALLLVGCRDGEKVVCPTPDDHGKQECIGYGAAYIETKDKVYCHTKAGLIMERRK